MFGFLTGLAWQKKSDKLWWIFAAALIVTIPSSLLSSLITAGLFGGITSSGSSVIVQLLAKTPLGLTLSCFIVQVCTDYLDRVIGFVIVNALMKKLPAPMLEKLRKNTN